jgi:peptide/nickel transport system substrate-binding protein
VNLRQNVKWSDGTAFSSADVAFTFNTVLKAAKGVADTQGVWAYLSTVTASDANTVVFSFAKAYTPLYYNILGQVYIVQQKSWANVSNPVTDNIDPVGTGPFKLKSFGAALMVYDRNTSYWNNSVNQIDELDYPAIKDNTTVQLKLIKGDIDWGAFGPAGSLQNTYVSKDPTHNHYWMALANVVVLYLDDSTFLGDSALHQAISQALDRGQMATQAENGYETPAAADGVPPTQSNYQQSKYANPATSADTATAESTLKAAGYTLDGNGYYANKDGKEVQFKINVPSDWGDWVALVTIMVQDLKAIHLNVSPNPISDDDYFAARSKGSFSAMIGGIFAGPTPYYQYNTHVNSANDANNGGWNWGHYKNAAFDALVKQYAGSSDSSTQSSLINQMEDLYAHDLPQIPLVNAASWFEYSTQHYTGWPDQTNPYAIGSAYQAPDNEQVVTHLKPVNS